MPTTSPPWIMSPRPTLSQRREKHQDAPFSTSIREILKNISIMAGLLAGWLALSILCVELLFWT